MAKFTESQISSKEEIRKFLRHAFNAPAPSKGGNVNFNTPDFPPIANRLETFYNQVKSYNAQISLAFSKQEFSQQLLTFLQQYKHKNILCTNKIFEDILKSGNIPYSKFITQDYIPDLAITYSDALVARNGGAFFTQRFSVYPSVKGIAKHLVVIAFSNNIVDDTSDLFTLLDEKYAEAPTNLMEVITPKTLNYQSDDDSESQMLITYFIIVNN